uniref:Uncharacterized protein n=1 Tax=Anopheles farauti TaxID=69004 RepID=A0A182Q1W3_9DIPT
MTAGVLTAGRNTLCLSTVCRANSCCISGWPVVVTRFWTRTFASPGCIWSGCACGCGCGCGAIFFVYGAGRFGRSTVLVVVVVTAAAGPRLGARMTERCGAIGWLTRISFGLWIDADDAIRTQHYLLQLLDELGKLIRQGRFVAVPISTAWSTDDAADGLLLGKILLLLLLHATADVHHISATESADNANHAHRVDRATTAHANASDHVRCHHVRMAAMLLLLHVIVDDVYDVAGRSDHLLHRNR